MRPFSVYLHVPFCSSRCGYCDFNTYTASELQGTSIPDYLVAAHQEIDLARREMPAETPAISTVFVGGGTPSLLSAAQYGELLDHLADAFGLADGAEVTTEANPESTTRELLEGILERGVNRLSLGMQSSRPHVLALLDRVHTAGRSVEIAKLAREVGFDDVSLDLIMGTPGESLDDWRNSLETALSANPDHISAYALIIEDGTRLAARIRRGEVPMPDDDDLADKYLLTEELLTASGFHNYETSNWARRRDGKSHEARHNLAYWKSHNWWGIGPGAHSHVDGHRWWNVKHPRTYIKALAGGESPIDGSETLDAEQQRVERVLLELRLAEGLPLEVLTTSERDRVAGLIERGLAVIDADRLALTLQGRLLADGVVRDLLD